MKYGKDVPGPDINIKKKTHVALYKIVTHKGNSTDL